MRELERMIADWRTSMRAARHVKSEILDELENHLREIMDPLLQSGHAEREAFQIAVRRLGPLSGIDSEFGKLDRVTWLPAKVAAGIGVIAAIAEVVFLTKRLEGQELRFLLAVHIFMLTLGYVTALLNGTLGICYVCQRCFSEFASRQLFSLRRASLKFSGVAAGLTATGILLGSVWSRVVWDRFWEWELKEIAALCVLAWLVLLVVAHRRRRIPAHRVLLLTIVGNVVVSFAWLGPFLSVGLRGHWSPYCWGILATVSGVSFLFILLGLAPTGWTRWSKA